VSILMSPDEFIKMGKGYISQIFKGMCEFPFQLAAHQLPQAYRFVVKLDEKDFEEIKYSDLYQSAQKIVKRLGAIRRDPQGRPFNAELKLFDPYFEGLEYVEIPVNI
jgi:hypothetical protein